MRRPGGAVRPAMKPTIGFLRPRCASSLRNCAASSSAEPPISPIMMIDSVASSARNISSTSMNSVPLTGSPPMPTAVVWPRPALRGLEHRLVGQRARARHNADRALLEDVARHDADLAFVRRHHARAVRPDQARASSLQRALDLDHVEHRDALGDADDQRDLGIDRLQDRVGGAGRRHVDDAGVGAGRRLRLGDGVEDRQAEVRSVPPLPGDDAADHLGAVGDRLLGMEGALRPVKPWQMTRVDALTRMDIVGSARTLEFGHGVSAFRAPGVQRRRRLEHQNDGLLGRASAGGARRRAARRRSRPRQLDRAVAKVDGDPTAEDEEGLVLFFMRVPIEDFAELGDLHLRIVDVAGDPRLEDLLISAAAARRLILRGAIKTSRLVFRNEFNFQKRISYFDKAIRPDRG